jgi:DNA-binding GntR family transcriptional regulator
MHPPLTRVRARDQVKTLLRSMIAEGALAGGEHLDEIGLSRRIGVSRTPLREALIALEGEGLVQSVPNKGFSLVTADEAMVRDVFPILAALEAQAVTLSGERLIAVAPELAALNERLARTTRKATQYQLDAAIHCGLTDHCGNARLLKLLETHRELARRFDGAGARGTADQAGSCREHRAIIAAVRAGELALARDLLLAHWRRGEDVVIAWLQSRR